MSVSSHSPRLLNQNNMFLPDLAYCDRAQIVNLLSMLVSDLLTEYTVTESNQSGRGGETTAGIDTRLGKIAAKYRSENQRSVQREGLIQAPTPSLFVDLHELLDGKEKIQHLAGFDDAILDQLKSGEFIELSGEIKRSPIEATMDSIVDLIERFGDMMFDEESERKNASQIKQFFKKDTATMLIVPASEVKHAFLTSISLKEENLFVDKYDIDGEFTIFGRVKRILDSQSKVDLFKYLPGKLSIALSQKGNPFAEFLKAFDQLAEQGIVIEGDMEALSEGSYEVEGPLVEINCIAVYRNA